MGENWLQTNFPKHQHLFEGIDLESFLNLKADDFKDVIPNFVQRMIFKNQYDKFVKMINVKVIDPSEIDEAVYIPEINQKDLDQILDVTNAPNLDFNIGSNNFVEEKQGCDMNLTSTVNCEMQNEINPVRKITTAQDIINIPSIALKIVIKKQELNQPLENIDRITIGKAVIHELLIPDLERVITSEEFSALSAAIVELFPGEIRGCYYTAAHCELQAQGKLYSAYTKYKANLRAIGLIRKRPKAESRSDSNEGSTDENNLGTTESVKYVLEETDNFEQIIICWKDSYEERLNRFLGKLSTVDYINTFPAFDIARGFELLCIDAELVNGTSIHSNLPLIAKKILIYTKRRKTHSLEVDAVLTEHDRLVNTGLDDANLSVCEQLTAIKLIPLLLSNPKKGKRKRASKSELTNLFAPHFETRVELLEKFPNVLEKFPRLFYVGSFLCMTAELRVADKSYLIENPVTGFDILFKSILGLSLSYPADTQHLWVFVQKAVYNISRPRDIFLAGVETFIQELNNIAIA